MVQRVHSYADGGKVVKDHLAGRTSSGAKLPGPESRRVSPTPLPKPKPAPRPAPRRYADGGKVASQKPRPPKPAPRRGDTVRVQPPKGEGTAGTLRNQRERQMKELGLRDGGKVKRKKRY